MNNDVTYECKKKINKLRKMKKTNSKSLRENDWITNEAVKKKYKKFYAKLSSLSDWTPFCLFSGVLRKKRKSDKQKKKKS